MSLGPRILRTGDQNIVGLTLLDSNTASTRKELWEHTSSGLILMDSIEHIKPYKDTSFALMLAAQELGHELVYLPKYGLFLDHGEAKATMQEVRVTDGISENLPH